jgi:hypothetical protein
MPSVRGSTEPRSKRPSQGCCRPGSQRCQAKAVPRGFLRGSRGCFPGNWGDPRWKASRVRPSSFLSRRGGGGGPRRQASRERGKPGGSVRKRPLPHGRRGLFASGQHRALIRDRGCLGRSGWGKSVRRAVVMTGGSERVVRNAPPGLRKPGWWWPEREATTRAGEVARHRRSVGFGSLAGVLVGLPIAETDRRHVA